jgi:hypothetical protein
MKNEPIFPAPFADLPGYALRVMRRGRLRLRDALNEIIGRHVRAFARGAGPFPRPGEMAVVTIELLRHRPDVCQKTNEQIRQRGFVGVLRKIHAHGIAFRTTDRAVNPIFCRVPTLEQRIGFLEFLSGNFEARAFETRAFMDLRGNSRILQSLLKRLGLEPLAKQCNGSFIHETI